MHDSKMAHKVQAYTEVQLDAQKQLDELQAQLNMKRGISAGFKASAEHVISQMRKFQGVIDEGEVDLDVGKVVIKELNQCGQALAQMGRNHELDVARMDGQAKTFEAQIKSAQIMINKEKAKADRDESREDKRDARRERRGNGAGEDTPAAVATAEGTSERGVTPISAAKPAAKKKAAQKKAARTKS